MSIKHPVIAITGSSGAGTSTVKNAFNHIFSRVGATPVIIEGDSFHKFDRKQMNNHWIYCGLQIIVAHFLTLISH